PATQEAGHEGVAGAKYIVDLDLEALADDAVLEPLADRSLIDDAAHGTAFENDGRLRQGANGPERIQQVVGARGDQDFLLGSHHQIAVREDGFQAVRDAVGSDITLESG